MICPVCEHRQDFGVECDLCGKELGGIGDLGPPPVRLERVEGLEATVAQQLGDVPLESVPGLELTGHAPVSVAADVTPGLERTGLADVGEVAVERVEGLALGRLVDDGQRTAVPVGPITCRYCRKAQAPARFCAHCGMTLPLAKAAPVQLSQLGRATAPTTARCRFCGAPAQAGERCGDCGREVPLPDA